MPISNLPNSYPTFYFLEDGKKVFQFKGRDFVRNGKILGYYMFHTMTRSREQREDTLVPHVPHDDSFLVPTLFLSMFTKLDTNLLYSHLCLLDSNSLLISPFFQRNSSKNILFVVIFSGKLNWWVGKGNNSTSFDFCVFLLLETMSCTEKKKKTFLFSTHRSNYERKSSVEMINFFVFYFILKKIMNKFI